MSGRDLANAVLWRLYRLCLHVLSFFQLRLGLVGGYMPNAFAATATGISDRRGSVARAGAILARLPEEPLSGLDIGCHIGYFTFALARRGGFCIGIDYERNAIVAAQALATLHRVANATFAQMDVTRQAAAALPKVDVVICLSIYHHWVRKLGRTEADAIMAALAQRAERYFVFDTGQPDEVGARWAEDLSFMRPDIDGFLRQYLIGFGFAKVHHLGQFASSISSVPRHLYIAERAT